MKTCEKCGETYDDNAVMCTNCNTPLPINKKNSSNRKKKICPNCYAIYVGQNVCPKCQCTLGIYDENRSYTPTTTSSDDGLGILLTILICLIPLLGPIFGIVYLIKGEHSKSAAFFLLSITVYIIYFVIYMFAH